MGVIKNPQTSGVRTPDEKWFPRAVMPTGEPRLWVFCFPGAGMESSIWTGVGTTLSPMPNPLCDFIKKERIALLGVQLPFRGLRRKEEHPKHIQQAAKLSLAAMRPMIERGNAPYVLIGYSMGAWIAYEVICLIKQLKLPTPLHFIAASMVSPNLPIHLRPWRKTADLDTEGFQTQLRAWNCNEVLFQKDMWFVYEPLLRADHNMLDEYKYTDLGSPLNNIPISVFRGSKDQQLADTSLFSGWFDLFQPPNSSTGFGSSSNNNNSSSNNSSNNSNSNNSSSSNSSKNVVVEIAGDHGLVFDSTARQIFFNKIVEVLDGVLLGIEYGQ